MAFTSTIKPYKFVNPSSISSGGGATLIVGGKKISGGASPQVKSARVTVLALNRIGMAMEGLGKTQQNIRDIIVSENKYLTQSAAFKKKREGYRRDQKSEQQSESFGQKKQDEVKNEVIKKEKKQLSWLEKIFGPFAGIISFVTKVVITQTVLRWMGDPKNGDKLVVFVKSFTKVFKWAFNIAYKSTDAVLTGFAKVFGSSDKKGLDRFGEVLNGLGTLLIGIAGFKALGYLLNPFSLVNDIIGLIDALSSGGGSPGGGSPSTETPNAKPRAAAQKVAENYGDDAARYYDDLIKRGKKPGDALNAVRGKFKKIPPKPKGMLAKVGDKITDFKKGITGGVDKLFGNFKKFGNNITKGARDKLVKSGEFLKAQTQKTMQPIAKAAYDFLESKGIIKLANNLGEKAVGTINKMPGYSKIMAKVQKEGGQEVLKKLGGKAIPVIGGLVNLYFAYDRLKNGDKSGAALEALSAVLDIAGLFTGGSTSVLSMVLDTYLFGRDFFPDLVKKENDAFGGLINSILGPIKGIKDSLPKLPWMAEGGIVNKPTIAGLGEAGPEAVIPLKKLGLGNSVAATIVGATQSALSRMGAAGAIAKSLIGPDLAAAENLFGTSKVNGGDSLGKSVMKGIKGTQEIEAGDDISIYLGKDNVTIRDKKNPTNNPTSLRGQLANILGALIWLSEKDLKGGSGGGGGAPSPSGGGGGVTGGASGKWGALLDLISSKESGGNYEAMYPSTTLKGATKMTIAEVARKATGAVGKYQQLPQYLISRAKAAGLNPDKDLYSPENQDKIVSAVNIEQNRGGRAWLAGKKSDEAFMDGLAYEFASLPDARGKFKYSGQSSSHKPSEVREALRKVKESSIKMAKGGQLPPGIGRNIQKPKDESKLRVLKGEAIGGLVKFAAGGAFKNGQLPASELQDIGKGQKLRKGEAADSFLRMALAAKKDRVDLVSDITDSYRDLAGQEYMFTTKPRGMAARPGSSKHGWGVALDIGTSKSQNWINKNGAAFGWGLPNWAKGGFEPWHFEKLGAATGSAGQTSPSTDTTSPSQQDSEPPETLESLMSKLKSAATGLNASLGYSSPTEDKTAKPGQTPPAPNTPSPKSTTPAKPAAVAAASGSGKKVNDVSDQVAKLEEAAKDASNYGHVIPLPINSGTTQIAYGGGTDVYTARRPITYGI